jgi:hypothetical protein
MTPELPFRTSPVAFPRPIRRLGTLWLLVLALPVGGCSFLQDEFTSFDRAAPSTAKAPDAPVSAEVARP